VREWKVTDTSIENNEIGNEPLTRLEIASISLAVELGIDPIDAYNLICELKTFSPEYHKRIQEIAQLYLEARSALLYLLEEIERTKQLENAQKQETLTEISYDEKSAANSNIQSVTPETVINHNLQQPQKTLNENKEKIEEPLNEPPQDKTEEQILEELHKIAHEQEKTEQILEKLRETTQTETEAEEEVIVSQEVKEEIQPTEHTPEEVTSVVSQDAKEDSPITEQVRIPEHVSQEPRLETKEEIEKWLSNTENQFDGMPVEKQEETMPRYIQLRALVCKDKKETGPSCIGCLIGNTIDCPLFSRTAKKR
jgi:hypothetical protein